VGGPVGQGGEGTKEAVSDGNSGAVRIRRPGYFDITLEKDFKAKPAEIDTGFQGEHPAGVRPSASAVARVRHLLRNPRPLTDD
jgi:hypothetical protein